MLLMSEAGPSPTMAENRESASAYIEAAKYIFEKGKPDIAAGLIRVTASLSGGLMGQKPSQGNNADGADWFRGAIRSRFWKGRIAGDVTP